MYKNVIVKYNRLGNLLAEYVCGDNQRLAKIKSNRTIDYYLNDHPARSGQAPGSARAMTSSGWSANYYPFGEIASQTGSPEDTRFDFTGQERDQGTGLIYFGARYLDPEIGRWMSADPLAEKYPSLNPYNYSANDPINKFDPDGKIIGTAIGTIVGGIGGVINAYINDQDPLAGLVEGATAGFITGAVVDLAVATGGSGLVIVGAAVVGGAGGNTVGDVAGQVISNKRSGQTISEAIKNVDINQTRDKAIVGAATGFIGGSAAAGMSSLGNSVLNATRGLQMSMGETVEAVAQTTGSFGNQGVQQITHTIGVIGKNSSTVIIKIKSVGSTVTKLGSNVIGENVKPKEEKKVKKTP